MQKTLKLSGYKRGLVLIVLGLCVAAALPPFHIWPLAFVGFAGLLLFLEKTLTKRAAFVVGWWFGVGFFGGGLYWLTNAFLVHADKHGWLIPIAVPALAALMGLFIGLTALLAHVLAGQRKDVNSTIARVILFAVAWTVLEWVRSWIFTGFPWNLMGTIWAFSDAMVQPGAWVGAFGLSFLTVLALSATAGVVQHSGRLRNLSLVLMVGLPVMMWGAGEMRLSQAHVETHEGIILRLVQPNIAQKDKWKRELKISNFEEYLNLSEMPGQNGMRPSHVIWPETAVTYALDREPGVLRAIASVVPKGGLVLTGVPRMTKKGVKPFQVWNSLAAINDQGDIKGGYDKVHLVPFGEYVPFRELIPLPKITAGLVDFTSGAKQQTIELDGLPALSPLICYEVIFPNHVLDAEKRPQWILNLTNDGWYGDSPGPYQHLISARMRAIEEGVPLVRVANTGVTMVSDAYGRMRESIGYGVRGFIDVRLPKPLASIPLGVRFGPLIWGGLLVLSYICAQVILRRRKEENQS